MRENLIDILKSFGLTQKESQIFIFLYQYGKKPASTIAKHIGDERTNTYKSLLQLVKKGFISEITKDGTKLFFVANKNIFEYKLNAEVDELEKKKDNMHLLKKEFDELEKQSFSGKPNIIFYEGIDGIKNIYDDIVNSAGEKGYKLIKFFASNTFENKSSNNFLQYSPNFLEKLKNKKIHLDVFLGNGISILEEIVKGSDMENVSKLPASNSSIQTFIFGDNVYIIIFKEIPYGIKIESEEYASIMHFLFRKVEIKKD
ncbi:MAG: helix-turn-helix domain-containing protein [Candidatus Gracilibacteria bacterium]|nr:helix-turn-helix domain-containing protein [Candidatus Gracilibacteria bacterium]